MSNQFKNDIESLGFEISKSGNQFNAFGRMYGGLWFDGKSYESLFNNIETYFKNRFHIEVEIDEVERNEFGDALVVSCLKCGNDVTHTNSKGYCKNCN
jgi:hypothetical protein